MRPRRELLPERLERALERLSRAELPGGREQVLTRRREPAADDDELGIEDVHKRCDSRAETAAEVREDVDRRPVAFVREAHETVRVGSRSERLASGLRRRMPGRERLEMAVSGASALARRA